MIKTVKIVLLLSLFNLVAWCRTDVQWTVIGAGPTGIMTVGLLLDNKIPQDKIVWLDPEFTVGRMGKHYQNVPGNGRVEQYIEFLSQCKTFNEIKSAALDYLYSLPIKQTPDLKVLVSPLIDITAYLRSKVTTVQDAMVGLDFHNDQWHITTNNGSFNSENVVLATGAHPRTVSYEGVLQIPLDVALDKNLLAKEVNEQDTIGVIGSGHSAILILKYLSELSVAQVVHLYKKPFVYPITMKSGIAWKETGLKGQAAELAKNVLEVNPPQNLVRIFSTPESVQAWIGKCTKIIYAGGFERNELPAINGDTSIYENYNRSSGLIGPRLYGIGIAFPQQQVDPLGNIENLVGLPYVSFEDLDDAIKQSVASK